MSSTDEPAVPRRPRARIEDVAQAANVSVATVSRALRGLPNVAESTRARVFEVATALQYEADPAAARLAAGRTRTVIVMVPHLASWYFSTVIAGAEAVCKESGYEFLVIGVGDLTECSRLLGENGRIERRADGIVLVNLPVTEAQAASLRERGVALSTVGTRTTGVPSVFIDEVEVGRIGAQVLIDLGHRRIGLISGINPDPLNFEVPKRRAEGFEATMASAGLEVDPRLTVGGNFGIDGGQEAMAVLLDAADPPTGVFAMSDEMAFGALMELSSRGLHPGVDVSIVGVDDHEFARVVGLTTIRQSVGHHGAAAARALIDSMHRPAYLVNDEPINEPTELIVRSTTGPAPR
jgi:LacI family transcriptional regulator, repressor for deo operon, udp, cdd, tsx, nupC, and nupG